MEKRFDALQSIFDGMSTAGALYNLFGQVIYTNKQMEDFVERCNLPIYSLTAHDFLQGLTDLNSDNIKQRLLQVTLNHADICVKVSHEQLQDHYILRIRPIEAPADSQVEGVPFFLLGILFEFIDISEAQKVILMKKDLYSHFFHQMRNDLGTINLYCRQLRRCIDERGVKSLDMMENILQGFAKKNVAIEDQLRSQRSMTTEVVPINPGSSLRQVLDGLTDGFTAKQITANVDIPSILSLVLAEPGQLSTLLQSAMEVLINDCDNNGSELTIDISDMERDGQREIVVDMRNQGYGVPEDYLQRLLHTPITELEDQQEPLVKLLIHSGNCAHWDVQLDVTSKLGEGFKLTLSLPVFDMT